MSLFGDLAQQALGSIVSKELGGNSGQNQAAGGLDLAAIAPVAMNLVQQAGGVEGVMQKLQAAGLGEHLQSWMGNGEHLPVSAEQIQSALGEHIDQAAQATGQDSGAIASGLAQALPQLLGALSSQGQGGSPASGLLEQALKGGLGKLLG